MKNNSPVVLATLAILTVINLGLLVYQFSAKPILRGRGIEIIDDDGNIRAQLVIAPANSDRKMQDGKTGYPETVIFRLITPDGKPRVKLTTSEEGSDLMLLGDSDSTYTILESHDATTSLKLRNSEMDQQIISPRKPKVFSAGEISPQ